MWAKIATEDRKTEKLKKWYLSLKVLQYFRENICTGKASQSSAQKLLRFFWQKFNRFFAKFPTFTWSWRSFRHCWSRMLQEWRSPSAYPHWSGQGQPRQVVLARGNRREIITVRGQSYVWRLTKFWPPTPLTAQRVCTPLFVPLVRGEDTLAGWGGGWGVNILEDARHSSVLCICKYFVEVTVTRLLTFDFFVKSTRTLAPRSTQFVGKT
jgi:hypothetical protein